MKGALTRSTHFSSGSYILISLCCIQHKHTYILCVCLLLKLNEHDVPPNVPLKLHCLGLLYLYHQLEFTWYLHQPESHELSQQNVFYILTETDSDPYIRPQVYMGLIRVRYRQSLYHYDISVILSLIISWQQ